MTPLNRSESTYYHADRRPICGLNNTREYIHSWRLAEAGSAGLVLGLDLETVRLERVTGDAAPEHRFVLGLGWRLEKARREDVALEFRFEGARLEPANENAEHRIGLTLTARW